MLTGMTTKDALYALLRVEDESVLVQNIGKVLTVLELTVGLWTELCYCYKAKELAHCCELQLNDLLLGKEHLSGAAHDAATRNLDDLRQQARKLQGEFHRAQQAAFSEQEAAIAAQQRAMASRIADIAAVY